MNMARPGTRTSTSTDRSTSRGTTTLRTFHRIGETPRKRKIWRTRASCSTPIRLA